MLSVCRPFGSDCGIVNVNIPTNGAEIGGAFGKMSSMKNSRGFAEESAYKLGVFSFYVLVKTTKILTTPKVAQLFYSFHLG